MWLPGEVLAGQPSTIVDLAVISTADGTLRRIHGSVGDGSAGVPVAGGFDCDGDGFRDYAMAAMRASPLGRSGAGEVYLVFGDGTIAGALDTASMQAEILKIAGDGASETAGSELWMGDVTGDGLGDLLVARQNFTPDVDRIGAGALTIVVGGNALRTQAATLQHLDLRTPPASMALTTVVGANALDRLGIWMRTGDVTGDGIADIVVGADQEGGVGATHAGAIYVIRGGSHLAVSQTIDLADFGTTALAGNVARIHPPAGAVHYHFGATCQIADLDGNGHSEVLVGAALNRAGASIRADGAPPGSAHASGGKPDGAVYVAWDDNFTADPWPAGLSFDITAPPSRTVIDGGTLNVSFGEEILGGLDYDNDGNADLFAGDIVGDGTAGQDRPGSGTGHVLYAAANLRGLQFSLDSLPAGILITTLLGAAPGDIAADTAAHGDFDGDGIADLVFSAPHGSPLGRDNAGIIYILHGQSAPWPELIDLANVLPPPGVLRITQVYGANGNNGTDSGDVLSYSAAAGDIDRDNCVDIITNEMLGNGLTPAADDTGNLIVISGALTADQPIHDPIISGHIGYYQDDRPVAGVTVDLIGMPEQATLTDSTGSFAFADTAEATWTIEPEKTADFGDGITAFDASYVLQAQVGLRALTPTEIFACDITGNGNLSSFDAAQILQFRVGTLSRFPVAEACESDWAFFPMPATAANQTLIQPQVTAGTCQGGAIVLDPLLEPAQDQDFQAILFGDCTGNWGLNNGVESITPAFGAQDSPVLRVGRLRRARGRRAYLPLYVEQPDRFLALEAQLGYDPQLLRPGRVHQLQSTPPNLLAVNRDIPGRVRIALAAANDLTAGIAPIFIIEWSVLQPGAVPGTITVSRALIDERTAQVVRD